MGDPGRVVRCAALLALWMVAGACEARAQGLPRLEPINPVVESRSGLYFQPLVEARQGWRVDFGLDYASMTEVNHRYTDADTSYLLDVESYRLNFTVARSLDHNDFFLGDAAVAGTIAGRLDAVLDAYHNLFGISFPERESRKHNEFAYRYVFRGGSTTIFDPSEFHLADLRLGIGHRFGDNFQSVFSATLPLAPEGYGRKTISLSALNTLRYQFTERLVYEGQAGLGYTPRHGKFTDIQNTVFFGVTSGLRYRFWGRNSLFANLYWASAPYHDADAPALQNEEFSIDAGWILRTKGGRDWRLGITEDLYPSGPSIDLVLRLGGSF